MKTGISTTLIRPFDPWRSPLCTCPQKWSLSPYTGCGHRCIYCYATSYIPNHYNPRIKKRFIERLLKDLNKLPSGALISMSNSSDPYTPPYEEKYYLTRRALNILLNNGFRVLITTKSNLVVRDIDILKKAIGRVAVAITITTHREEISRKIEPFAPPPKERIKVIKILSREGVPVIVRIDPILPGINDDYNDLKTLIKLCSSYGAVQITSSTFKARSDSFKRVLQVFPELRNLYRELYLEKGEKIHGYMYMHREVRENILRMVRELVLEEGLIFETCREGLQYLNTPGFYCDGSTFAYLDIVDSLRY